MITFGCRLNAFESEIIKKYAAQYGLVGFCFINTCAVTAEAERQVRQKIRQLAARDPDLKIVITGCMAQAFPTKLEQMPEISFIIGNHEKITEDTYRRLKGGTLPRVVVSDQYKSNRVSDSIITSFDNRARAFVSIQTGCSNHCSYCLIQKARGSSQSAFVQHVVDQVKALGHYPEVVLTGVNISEYGCDLGEGVTLVSLIKRILNLVPELRFLGISSISPYNFGNDLIELIGSEKRIAPYVHLSVQSGDNDVLRAMRREPYSREDIINLAQSLRRRRPEIILGADIITGFPSETSAQFENTIDLIRTAGINLLHVFPFSKRIGTEAYYMGDQVPHVVAKERLRRLKDLEKNGLMILFKSMIGARVDFISEKELSGKTLSYLPVSFVCPREVGQVDSATVIGFDENGLCVE